MNDRLKACIFLYCILLLILSYYPVQNIINIFALQSTPFVRQEVSNMQNNGWIFWHLDNKDETIVSKNGSLVSIPTADNKSQCTFDMQISPVINSTSYLSDGNKINATVWFSSQLLDSILIKNDITEENFNSSGSFLPLWHNLKFTMAIDIFSTFHEGVDYRVELSGEKMNSTYTLWKQVLYEISPEGSSSNIIYNKTFDKFPYQNKNFVNFSIDLKSIGYPQKYRLLFYITELYVKDGKLCRMVDSTNWLLAPPPQFNIVISPSSVFMRPGEHKDIPVIISGNTELQSNGTLSVDNTNKEDANAKFLSNKTVISSFANGSSILHIDVPNLEINKSKILVIPITSNISFPTTIINKGGQTFYNNKSISLIKNSSIVLTILPSLTWQEKLNIFAETLKPIGELWQIFIPIAGAIITAVFYFNRKKGDRKKKDKDNRKIDEF